MNLVVGHEFSQHGALRGSILLPVLVSNEVSLSQVLVVNEAREHGQGIQRLVFRSLVTSTLKGSEGVGVKVFDVTSGGTVNGPWTPWLNVAAAELSNARLVVGERNSHDVDISSIDENVESGLESGESGIEGNQRKVLSDVVDVIANIPYSSDLSVEGLLDGGLVEVSGGQVGGSEVLASGPAGIQSEFQSSVTGAEILVKVIGINAGLSVGGFNLGTLRGFDEEFLIDDSELVKRDSADSNAFRSIGVEGAVCVLPSIVIGV